MADPAIPTKAISISYRRSIAAPKMANKKISSSTAPISQDTVAAISKQKLKKATITIQLQVDTLTPPGR